MIRIMISPQNNLAISYYDGDKEIIFICADTRNVNIASIVTEKMRDDLSKLVSKIRKDAYNEGHKDKTAKRKKAKSFSGELRTDSTCGGCY